MRYWKLAALCGLLLGGLTLGGCSDDDKKKGGGGSTVFPGIPTARPDITGFPIVIDVSGRTSGPTTTGGAGGSITIATGTGDVRKDDGRGMPGINANYLTAAVMADNLVNYTELASIDPAAVTVTGNTAVLDLVGVDFHLPVGVTMNLTDLRLVFGLDTLVIRAFGAGDVIRIDGLVQGAPLGAFTGIHVSFESLTNPGTAIAISGTINLEPVSNNGLAGGNFSAHADQGSILVRGTISSIGSPMTAGICGPGGNVSLFADRGSILLREGIVQANGGNGDFGGGNGGSISVFTPHHLKKQRVPFGFRANGGNATGSGDGGNGGFITLTMRSPLDLFTVCEVNGGNSAGDDGGDAGICNVAGMIVQGVLVLNANGGNGDEDGGSHAGACVVGGESLTGLAVVATRNGGTSTNNDGGDAGTVLIAVDGRYCVNVLLDLTAHGGSGDTGGGNAGTGLFMGYSEFRNANLVVLANGGSGDIAGNGGVGGILYQSALGETVDINVDAQLNGGNGETLAGDGGTVSINAGPAVLTTEVNVTANGGNLTGAPTAPSKGGNGGTLDIGLGQPTSVNAIVSGSLAGGNGGTVGDGGLGGIFRAQVGLNGSDLRLNTVGTMNLRGGSATAGTGGRGGFAGVSCGSGGSFDSNLLNLDLRGGDSTGSDGGDGFSVGGAAFEASFAGPAWFRGGTITVSGGNGSTASGTGAGGDSGVAIITSISHDIHFGATILAHGGNGVLLGGNAASSPIIEMNVDSDGDRIAGTLRVTGTLRSRGGDASNGIGGSGGFIYLHSHDNTFPKSGGDVYVSGLVESIGGNGAGTNGVGGAAQGIEISSGGNVLDISGTVRSLGGAGPAGGAVGDIDFATTAITNIRISGTIEALGGTATGVAVDGAVIRISSPFSSDEAATITVTSSAVIRSNGGAGGTTNGAAGFIEFDAQGAGTNVTIAAGATVECLDGAGVSAPANITIN